MDGNQSSTQIDACAVGPRLKRKDYRKKQITNSPQPNKFQMVKKNSDGTIQNITKPPRIARREQNKPPRKSQPSPNKQKKHKEPVITPFNPISEYNEQQQNYDLAAQQLGIYNPHQPASLTVPTLGTLPPLLTTLPMSGYNPVLPNSIDASLYLSLTPSPPQSPDPTLTMNGSTQQKQTLDPETLSVAVPGSLTPSP